jgi:hypothetical protein
MEPAVTDPYVDLDSAFGPLPHAVIGAVAANQYMPARQTADIDFALAERDVDSVTAALRQSGWTRLHPLSLRLPLTGWTWETGKKQSVDVITIPGVWGEEVVDTAAAHRVGGLPMATLPHLVALKMVAGRATDAADLTRMLGHQDDLTLETVRAVVRKVVGSDEMADLDQLIELGRLEYGLRPPSEP